MNLSYGVLMFITVIVSCLLEGVIGLKLREVVIPPYKLRGDHALLECIYELNDGNNRIGGGSGTTGYGVGGSNSNSYHRSNSNRQHQQHYHHQQQYYQPAGGGDGGYQQPEEDEEEISYHNSHHAQQQHYPYNSNNNQEEYRLRDTIDAGTSVGGGAEHLFPYDSTEQEHLQQQNDGREALYSVKWYKDNEEFYRYIPKSNTPQQSYRVDGIRVDHLHSDSSKVLLRGLTLKATGLYRCEVSAEAPNFSSAQGEGRMDIVFLPKEGPLISGKEEQYQIGDTLSLNCTSGKSHPASQLQWFINDEPLIHSNYLIRYNDTVHTHGLITSTLGLQLTLDVRHFQDGAMKVKCVASVSPVLWKGGKESVVQRRPTLIENREAMLLVLSSSSCLESSLFKIFLGVFLAFSRIYFSRISLNSSIL